MFQALSSNIALLTFFKHTIIDVDQQAVLRKFKGPANRDRNAWAGFY